MGYLAGSAAYVALPLVIVFTTARPSRAAVKDMAWPSSPPRRLAAAAFWAVLLAPALIAPLAGLRLVSLWSMSAFTLLPVMLLSSPGVALARREAAGVLTLALYRLGVTETALYVGSWSEWGQAGGPPIVTGPA